MRVNVYGRADCVQCEWTQKLLRNIELPFRYFDIDADEAAMKIVEESGKMQLPYVVAGDQSWHGLSPDRIKALRTAQSGKHLGSA
jgi:glutaredoxin